MPTPAVPGTYTLAQSGSSPYGSIPARGQLVVKPASGDEQEWETIESPQAAPSITTVDFSSTGPKIVSETEQTPEGDVVCTFNPPLPTPPWPPAVGAHFSGTGNCGQGFTVTVSGELTGQKTYTVAGRSFDVWVLDANLTASGDGITASGTEVAWLSPALRLPLYESTTLTGKYSILTFSETETSQIVAGPGI